MQELKSCFAPPNYHSNKHVSFAQAPIICTSAPFLWKDEYSDDMTFEENEEEENEEDLQIYDDDSESQPKSRNEWHSFFLALIFVIFSITVLYNVCYLQSSAFATGLMNNFGNTFFLRSILDLLI